MKWRYLLVLGALLCERTPPGVVKEAEFGVVESVKSVSDLYLPVAGKVLAVNGDLEDEPETLNEDPYGKGWIVRIKMKDPAQAKQLLSAKDYLATIH